jgi:zinc transporter
MNDIKSVRLNLSGGLSKEKQGENPCWNRINYTSESDRAWLKQQKQISKQAKTVLLTEDTRPRLILEENSLIICLRGINLNKTDDPEDMISIRLWMDENSLVTSSNRQSQSIQNVLKSLEQNNGPTNLPNLLLELIIQLTKISDEFVDQLDEHLDKEEDSISESSFETFNPKMSQFRRQIATIKRYLAPQKEALDKLFRSKNNYFKENFYDDLYIQIDKLTHVLENLDLLRERALVLQEQFSNLISHQQNSRLYLLAIISAIFLPLTFLSGLLGMNVGGLPGIESHYAFWLVTGFCIIVSVGLLLIFKKNKWF